MDARGGSSSVPGAFQALADNPLHFLSETAIEFFLGHFPAEYHSDDGSSFRSGKAGVKLVKKSSTSKITSYYLHFIAVKDMPTDKNAIDAFVLAYKDNRGNDDVPFVDIPIKAYAENTFLFTAGLSGCSVIVTKLDGKTYRVFHDRRMDSAVLYCNKDVQMRVDFNNYRIGERLLSHTGVAMTLMLFQRGKWQMFVQRQIPPPVPGKGDVEVYSFEQKGPVSAGLLEKEFNDRRAVLQTRVKSNARLLNVDESVRNGAVDGAVVGLTYNERAISGWNALRSAIESKLNDPTCIHKDVSRVRFDNMVSSQIDETWIWLQIQKQSSA